MRLALSCTGEGFGHAARTVALAEQLRNWVEVVVFCPSRVEPFIRKQLPNTPVRRIPYFAFAKKNDRIDYFGTLTLNVRRALFFSSAVSRLARQLADLQVDGVVSDYDPYMAFAARRLRMPVLHLNHPGIVLRTRSAAPTATLAKLWALFVMGTRDKRLICSFYNGDVGPIIRRDIAEQERSRDGHILVYLKRSYRRVMMRKLRRLGIDNVEVFPDPQKDFNRSLARCSAVVSSAGHQMMSEAIVLGKPIFAIPQWAQFEQLLNAKMLEATGCGAWSRMRQVSQKLPRFLAELESYPKPARTAGIRIIDENHLQRAAWRILSYFASQIDAARPEPSSGVKARYGRVPTPTSREAGGEVPHSVRRSS
jgi:uncharacterized protein (TIGR00661 family)